MIDSLLKIKAKIVEGKIIGNVKYPKTLWANLHVSSSAIVQGNLNPTFLLNGILGELFPMKSIIIDTVIIVIFLLIFSENNKFKLNISIIFFPNTINKTKIIDCFITLFFIFSSDKPVN